VSNVAPLRSNTNLFLLFLAPRSCDHTRFGLIPQLSYSVPSLSALREVNLICKASTLTLDTAELGSSDSKELDISGVHPLDNSTVDSAADAADVLTVPSLTHDDYIWFQAPITVKGYTEKIPDVVGFWGC